MNLDRLSLPLAVAALCAPLLGLAPARADAQAATGAEHSPVGTWKITVTPPVDFIPVSIAFSTYSPGGGMVSSPTITLPPPLTRMGVGNGSWERIGPKEYASTHVGFAYDANDQPIGIVKFTAVQRMTSKDTFEGRSQLSVCNLKLECQAPNPGFATITGTRLAVEPLVGP